MQRKKSLVYLGACALAVFCVLSLTGLPAGNDVIILPEFGSDAQFPLHKISDSRGRLWMKIMSDKSQNKTRRGNKELEYHFQSDINNVAIETDEDYNYYYDDEADEDDDDNKRALRDPHGMKPDRLLLLDESSFADSQQRDVETQIPNYRVSHDPRLHDNPATQIQIPALPWEPGEVRNQKGVPLVVGKTFWSPEVEDLVPEGNAETVHDEIVEKVHALDVAEMRPPEWNRCGRPLNQFVVLSDATEFCARYRYPHEKLVHGEVLSYYLSKLLGFDSVPIVVLSVVNSSQWRHQNISRAGWQPGKVVALIQWKDGVETRRSRVRMPKALLEAYENRSSFSSASRQFPSLSANDLSSLVQWSDLVLFDYLTGHYDRVASMQDGADRENKSSIMHENIRNLRQVWQSGKLWLIDNESGFRDAYEMMFNGREAGQKFVEFHEHVLNSICVFRKKTVAKVAALAAESDPHLVLERFAAMHDPLYERLKWSKNGYELFKYQFHKRLKRVVEWVRHCGQL